MPFLDHLTTQLTDRFKSHQNILSGFMALLPKYHAKYGWKELKPTVDHYSQFMTIETDGVMIEYEMYCEFWQQQKENK